MTETEPKDDHDGDNASTLERRFRRLLWAYPRWYRRHRGEEMLGTLLDGCADDQREPSRAQRRDILRSGLRCRLRVRGGAAPNILAVGVALVGAVVGSCVGAGLSWLGAPDLPGREAVADLATETFAGAKPAEMRGDPTMFTYDAEFYDDGSSDPAWLVALIGGDDYGRGEIIADYRDKLSVAEWHAIMPDLDDRLEAAGWRVTEMTVGDEYLDPDARSLSLTAVRGDYEMTVETSRSDSTTAELWLGRAEPAGLRTGLIAGAVFGLLAGWLIMVRIVWQVRVVNPRRRYPTLLLLTIAVQIGSLPLAMNSLFIGMLLAENPTANSSSPPWWPFMSFPYRPLLLLAAVIATVALLLAAIPHRRSGAYAPPPRDRDTSVA